MQEKGLDIGVLGALGPYTSHASLRETQQTGVCCRWAKGVLQEEQPAWACTCATGLCRLVLWPAKMMELGLKEMS